MKVSRFALGLALGKLVLELAGLRKRTQLRGATAVVCGASRGLGRAIALELVRRGVDKIAICARTEEDLDAFAAELVERGVHVVAERCDLSSPGEVERFIDDAGVELGPIDVLVTNAATITVGPIGAWTRADFEEAHANVFRSTLHPVLAVAPLMRARGKGTIAMVTSIGARVGVPHLAPYCAAKFATMGLAESIRPELALDGVNVLTAVPGLMRTGSFKHAQFKGDHDLEYAWFGAATSLPLVTIDADRAARRIVSGIARGAIEVSFTPEARLSPAVRTLMPKLWTEAMTLVARMLPRAPVASPTATERKPGTTIERESTSPVVAAIRRAGQPYAERHAQT
ncbi:MAG: SDR family NAD(P)-dependent oxidoreductase [Labilithrix sp.]|nr:SDR family NAD(P)-dependent oxidoreductase [Labilithrix sp.]MCW5813904.1 SDR family NAD(P)-dependent oxidoreductase [Labilithrix sp.]